MSRTRTPERRRAMLEARREIIDAANKHRVDPTLRPFSTRTLQSAVCAVRRRLLVGEKVLRAAGFRA